MAEANEAGFALETYRNYVRAWKLAIEREYEGGPETVEISIRRRQEGLPSFKKMQGGGQYSPQLASEYCRAKLTLIAMERLPVDTFSGLAATANLWLPIQAYFAVQAMGNALYIASGQEVPGNHRAFLAAFSRNIVQYLPFPFNALCIGGPTVMDFTFKNILTSPDEVLSQNQLEDPKYSEGHRFLGKSLSTTRERSLSAIFDNARSRNVKKGRTRRRLMGDEKCRISGSLHSTSIADFLYRMRRRANYDDPNMYLKAFEDVAGEVDHYRLLLNLSKTLIDSMNIVISRKIGRQNMERMDRLLPS